MSNIQTGAERMPHDLSHLGFLAGHIGRLITISTTPVIAGVSFEMDAVRALRLSFPTRRSSDLIWASSRLGCPSGLACRFEPSLLAGPDLRITMTFSFSSWRTP